MLLTPCAGAIGWEEEMIPDGQCYQSLAEGLSRKFVCEGKSPSAPSTPSSPSASSPAASSPVASSGPFIAAGVVGVIVIAAIVYCSCKKRKNPSAKLPDAGTPQGMPTAPQVQIPMAETVGIAMAEQVSMTTTGDAKFGAKFDPNTGQPIPKFDPTTGKQNWSD